MFVGRVQKMRFAADGQPLLFFRGGYRHMRDA